jgi:hypothetical protein
MKGDAEFNVPLFQKPEMLEVLRVAKGNGSVTAGSKVNQVSPLSVLRNGN